MVGRAASMPVQNDFRRLFADWYGSRTWRCELGEGPGLADVILLRDVRV